MDFVRGEKIGLVGALMVFIGAFLPWASWGGFSASGTEGDGIITLVFGIIVGALIYFRSWDSKNKAISSVIGLLVLAIGVYDASNIASVADAPFGIGVEVGTGLYITVLGGLIVLLAGILGFLSEEPKGRTTRSNRKGGGL